MAIIGIFTRTPEGKLSGNLRTLTLNTRLQFVPETNIEQGQRTRLPHLPG